MGEAANGSQFAAKTEDASADGAETLVWEHSILDRLEGLAGFPNVHDFGLDGQRGVMIMDLLGDSLGELHAYCNYNFSLKTAMMIGCQLLRRLSDMHSRGIVHRDVKPSNFVVGRGPVASTIYAIDFGLANDFRVGDTGQHVPYNKSVPFAGTIEYASARSQRGVEQSRRDDLEALGYMLMQFLCGQLPWEKSGSSCPTDEEWFKHCAEQKALLPLGVICEGCPRELQLYLSYVGS